MYIQISLVFNERNNGTEKQLVIFKQKCWYKTEQLAIIQDHNKIMKAYDQSLSFKYEMVIKSSLQKHVGWVGIVRD